MPRWVVSEVSTRSPSGNFATMNGWHRSYGAAGHERERCCIPKRIRYITLSQNVTNAHDTASAIGEESMAKIYSCIFACHHAQPYASLCCTSRQICRHSQIKRR